MARLARHVAEHDPHQDGEHFKRLLRLFALSTSARLSPNRRAKTLGASLADARREILWSWRLGLTIGELVISAAAGLF